MLALAIAAAAPVDAQGFEPVAPGNLTADVNGVLVNLSWEWGNAGNSICSGSFEEDEFAAPWSVKNTYSYAPEEGGNWMIYDFADYPDEALNHDGTRSALLMMSADGDYDDLTTFHQDEWLIARPGTGAVYMDFWYFLYPELREVGAYPDFPDHYYVMISRDNGNSWHELWDGRWDMGPGEGVQQASLFLGEPTDENTLVAFNAVSAEEESLYFLWAVDDVNFYTADQASKRGLNVTQPKALRAIANSSVASLYRHFTPSDKSAKAQRRISEMDWLNGGNITYRVYLDDEMIADYLKARKFTDYSSKDPGEHVYTVMAWSEAEDMEYASASATVNIEEYSFAPARNIEASYEEQNGRYSISVRWDAPEGDLVPDHYNVFVNGKSIGWVGDGDELELGQSGLYKGAYTFSVVACYTFPDGESEPIYASVFPGTVPMPVDLKVSRSGSDAQLTWKAPEDAEKAPSSYRLYRGTELLDNITSLSYTDRNVPEGEYLYSLHAVYADGAESLPATAEFIAGEPATMGIPYIQAFDSAHLPAGWSVELVDIYESVKDMYAWRFDNWFETEFPESAGMSGYFPCVSGVAAGMNRLETYLVSPLILIPSGIDVALSFDKYYFEEEPGPTGSAQFLLQISSDFGDNWEEGSDLVTAPNGKCVIDLTDYAGQTIQLRWAFMSRNSGIAAIDNVVVYDEAGIESIATDSDNVVEVYTVDGLTVARAITAEDVKALPAGLYIIRTATKSSKIIVR